MECVKCKKEIEDDSVFCRFCGKKQITERKHKKRANGTGCINKLSGNRAKPWMARKNDVLIGTFATRTEAQKALEAKNLECKQFAFADTSDLMSVTTSAAEYADVIYVPTDNTVAANTGIIDNICQPAGIPVVVWEEAAVADFVKREQVGVTVASLNELGRKLSALTASEYEDMRQNALRISRLTRSGHYLTTAIMKGQQ